MTAAIPNDGLLKAARILTTIFMVLLAIGFVALAVAIPIVLLGQSHVAEAMLPDATTPLGGILGAIVLVLLFGMGFTALGFKFLQLLRQIINSVGQSDPFVIENATRLTRMGWIAIIVELLKLPAGGMVIFLATQLERDDIHIDMSFSFMGILVGILLFILARVFRHGAAMREDLEGTV